MTITLAATPRHAEILKLRPALEVIACRSLGPGADAEDAVQETLARAFGSVAERDIPAGAELRAFVYAIARNVVVDAVRRRIRDGVATCAPEPVSLEPSPLEMLIREEERVAMQDAIAELPPRDRELLRWCFVEGLPLVQIARLTAEPVERLRKRKSRAMARLRELLGARRVPDLPASRSI